MASKAHWTDRNKQEALELMKELAKKIRKGDLVVTTVGFWSADGTGTSILRIDVKESEFVKVLGQ